LLFASFPYLQFSFVFFWQNNFGAKAACKMLMEWTTVVHLTNILVPIYFQQKITNPIYKYVKASKKHFGTKKL